MTEKFISEIDSHLSHIIDKLSAISSTACMIEHVAGTEVWQSKITGETVSVAQMTISQGECVSQANDHIDQIRQILRAHGNTNLQGV